MEENKWMNRMTNLTSFSMGVVLTAGMISGGLLTEWIWILLFSVIVILLYFVLQWVRGIDYMDTHHPEYKGEDLFGEDDEQ